MMVSSFSSLTLVENVVSPQMIPLGQILLRKRWLTSQELLEALELQSSYRLLLGEILVRSGRINPGQLETALQEQKWRVRGFWLIT